MARETLLDMVADRFDEIRNQPPPAPRRTLRERLRARLTSR